MNRYRSGGPSKATATTLCQKCLKRGHYSYECTAAAQERPYVSRPSRTQQLLNPKLAPKVTESKPPAEEPKPEKVRQDEPGSKKRAADESNASPRKRSRSVSSSASDSDSVSTISTNRSRSRSHSPPRRRRRSDSSNDHRAPGKSTKDSDPGHEPGRLKSRDSRGDYDRSTKRQESSSHRRWSTSAGGSPSDRDSRAQDMRRDRPAQARRSRSRSPYRREYRRDDRERDTYGRSQDTSTKPTRDRNRQRSISPYSKRVALTQGMDRKA